MIRGQRNHILDVAGMALGHADDALAGTGTTVLVANAPMTAGVHVMGGAPGTRETDLLAPDRLVQKVDAIVLSGGSAFGLDAAGAVATGLARAGRGHAVGTARVPIVPAAILFDLLNGGDKSGDPLPYGALGAAALAAAGQDTRLGSVGAGMGAVAGAVKGGLGAASAVLALSGGAATVGALVAVNSYGSVIVGDGPWFWAGPFELDGEFGGLGPAPAGATADMMLPDPALPGTATTLAIVATDAALDQAGATRLAVAAHAGLARAIVPSHTLLDGDTVFAISTGAVPLADPIADTVALGHAAAICLSRAIARGVHAATPAPWDRRPCWSALARPAGEPRER